MILDGDRWRAWYGAGDSFDVEDGRQYPRYNIRHAFSADGIHLNDDYQVCIDTRGGEYRVGRPFVIKHDRRYKMFFGAGTKEEGYRLAYADSADGLSWSRKDEELGMDVSELGWDSDMQAYPSVVTCGDNTYMFYNGNNYGHDGFGYAVLRRR